MDNLRLTQKGYDDLKKELEELQASRPPVVEDVSKARDMGDLKENGYYQASKAKLRSIDSRIMRVKYYLKIGKIIENNTGGGISIGNTVTLANKDREMTFQFVGDLEANPSEKKLSLLSPIGIAVEGKKEGDEIEITTPSGNTMYIIKKVS